MTTLSAQELHEQGVRYYNGDGVTKNVKKAIECFEQAIELGNLKESKSALGFILYDDKQSSFDQKRRGEKLLEEAAAEGDVKAQRWYIMWNGGSMIIPTLLYLVTFRFSLCADMQRKNKIAKKYKKDLLAAGDVEMLYREALDHTMPKTKIMEELAEKEYAPAEYRLGEWYANGYPYKKDVEKARYWLTRAHEHGIEKAKEMLDSLHN